MRFCTLSLLAIFLITANAYAQNISLKGNVFESGNRGYLSNASIVVKDAASGQVYCDTNADQYGIFKCDLPPIEKVILSITKETYKPYEKNILTKDLVEGANFLKIEMEKAPGYLFEITMADKRDSVSQIVDAIIGAQIEVYNNTTEKEVLKLENHPSQEFKMNLQKGNHYTVLIRKQNYLAKQMEVYVNIKGCIVCFEGISSIKPGVTENLTAGNEYGVYLANVELEKIYTGKSFEVKNILYEVNSASLTSDSKKELDKIVNLIKYNPNLSVELGSHTDTRGNSSYNQSLSDKRAKAAVDYLTQKGGLSESKIVARGYGDNYPKNKCAKNVKCSEAEHLENRRTEFKIIGISDDWFFKPLVNIKTEEKFEREYFSGTTSLGGVSKSSPSESENKVVETKNNPSQVIEEKGPNTTIKNVGNNTKTVQDVPKTDKVKTTKSDLRKDKTESKNQEVTTDETKVMDGGKQETESTTDLKSGLNVLLFSGPKALPMGKSILQNIPNAYLYKDALGILHYLVSGFVTIDEAKSFLDENTLKSFPQAKIVKAEGDKITSITK